MDTQYRIAANSPYLPSWLQKKNGYFRVTWGDTRQHGWVECLVYKSANVKPAFVLIPAVELQRREGRKYVPCNRPTY